MSKITPEHIQGILMNPFYTLQLAPKPVEEHGRCMGDDDKEWVRVNSSLIQELGAEQRLTQLLDILEGDFVTAADMGQAPSLNSGFPRFRKGKQKRKKQRRQKK